MRGGGRRLPPHQERRAWFQPASRPRTLPRHWSPAPAFPGHLPTDPPCSQAGGGRHRSLGPASPWTRSWVAVLWSLGEMSGPLEKGAALSPWSLLTTWLTAGSEARRVWLRAASRWSLRRGAPCSESGLSPSACPSASSSTCCPAPPGPAQLTLPTAVC